MITLVAHDAGGAELLSSYVRQHDINCLYVLEGPALNIFERKLGPIETLTIEEAIQSSTSILCGTSWQSSLELNAIKLARSLDKHSVAFLDHWTNYNERFIRDGEIILPDEIWVGDVMAETMAKEIFPTLQTCLVENPYLKDVRQDLKKIQIKINTKLDSLFVLYVCEPVREHALKQHGDERYWGYIEEEALRYFLTNIAVLGKPVQRIVIRPHPSESVDKYKWVQYEFDLPIVMGGAGTLIEEIAESNLVVGCESMAMIIGLAANKRVVSSIPPGGKACSLPHAKIERLQDLLGEKSDSI